MLITYIDTFEEESSCIKKFSQDYERYRERVPRVKFVTGILHLLLGRLKV